MVSLGAIFYDQFVPKRFGVYIECEGKKIELIDAMIETWSTRQSLSNSNVVTDTFENEDFKGGGVKIGIPR